MGIWQDLDVASFQPDGKASVYIAVQSIEKDGGNRLVRRTRPYRAGTKLDSTGRKERSWRITAIFHNDVVEAGLLDSPPIYPDRLVMMEQFCEMQVTGTLHLPMEKNIRCRCDAYSRKAEQGMRDGEILIITFVEDNEEEGVTSEAASVKATVKSVVEQAVFDAESNGCWDGSLEDLTAFASELEGLMNAPGEMLAGLEQKADRVKRAAEKCGKALSGDAEGRNKLLDPDGSPLAHKLNELMDMSARAKSEGAGSTKTVTRTWATATDIYSIAAEVNQDPGKLIQLNGTIRDLGFIPAGTPVTVLAS